MKKTINLLNAHGIEVFSVDDNFFIHEGESEVCINFWDADDAKDYLGYHPIGNVQLLKTNIL